MPENIVLTEATYYILLSLYDPQHGYGIMQEAERLSRGRVRLAAGTLYGALNSMVEETKKPIPWLAAKGPLCWLAFTSVPAAII